ncbi:hypothetical protein KR018_001570 [Drosophila ironensis]|nr:hypothetical protein KR018_001570 [Drosophila ironensis]
MTGYIAKKALLLVSLLFLGSVQASPLNLDEEQELHVRKERQLKGTPATEADMKMVANVTPTVTSQPMMTMAMGMPMNQMALNAVGSQLVRYPNYPGLIYPGITGLSGLNGIPGLQTNIANNFPSYPDPSLAGGLPGFGSFGYPPAALPPMYGASLAYPNPQLPNGFVPQPSVDNFQALNNIVNMANIPGLGGATGGLYPPPQGLPPVQVNMAGLYAPPNNGGFLERMNMQAYAPGF